jgi:putative DNA primase/helicase
VSEDAILRVSKDDALADLLIAAGLGEKVRYDHSLGHWLIWNGVRWKPDRVTQIYDEVRLVAIDLMAAADDQKDPGEFRKMLLPLFDTAKKATVLKSLAARESIRVTADQFDQDPYLMGFENGILDLRTRAFDENPPSTTLITKSTNIAWNPDAACPAFDAFMADIMGDDEELVLYLLTLLGYSLFGLQSEQKFWLWVGRGANGKGVLARTMLRTLGDYGSAPSSALYMKTKSGAAHAAAARPEIIKLLGMRFTAMSEPPGQQFDEQLLKSHTGEDVIVARDLYRGADHMLSFAPTHKIVFLANEAPKTEDVGISMRRRARMVRFEQDYSGVRGDKLIEERLGAEVEGIAQRLATFALGWYQNGLPEPTKVYQWSREYIEENDPLAQFIEDECYVAPDARASATVLWNAYRMWEGRQGEVDRPLNRTQFGTLLGGRFRRVKGDSSNVYVGVRVRSNEDTTLDEPDAA